MTFAKKYLYPAAVYFAVFLLGAVIVLISAFICPVIYDYLVYIAPGLFPTYSPISQPDEYEALSMCIELAVTSLTLVVISYITLRLDNARFEHTIRRTEGFFTIPGALGDYVREFWLTDLITTAIAPTAVTLTYFLIPKEYMNVIFDNLLWSGSRLGEYFGAIESILITVAISVLARLVILPRTLKVWRANWLTCAVE